MRDYEELSRKHFNSQADKYDETNSMYYSKEGKISSRDIEKYLSNHDYKKLLDVGTGTGYLIDILSKQKEAEYHGLDLSEEMIKVAKSKNIPNATFIVGKANKLPYPDDTFDIVTCSQSFHHYPYQMEALKEAYRVLKPGGIYILSDTGVGGALGWIYNNIIFKIIKSGDYNTTNKEGVEKMMKAAKFRIIKKYNVQHCLYTVIGKKMVLLNNLNDIKHK